MTLTRSATSTAACPALTLATEADGYRLSPTPRSAQRDGLAVDDDEAGVGTLRLEGPKPQPRAARASGVRQGQRSIVAPESVHEPARSSIVIRMTLACQPAEGAGRSRASRATSAALSPRGTGTRPRPRPGKASPIFSTRPAAGAGPASARASRSPRGASSAARRGGPSASDLADLHGEIVAGIRASPVLPVSYCLSKIFCWSA